MLDDSGLTAILQREGTLGPEGLAAARDHQRDVGGNLRGALLEVGAVDESSLLRAMGLGHGTRYVTHQTLAAARLAPTLASIVPEELARQHGVCPIKLEADGTLRLVARAPSRALTEHMEALPGVERSVFYVALDRTVDAAIARLYRDDDSGFREPEPVFQVVEDDPTGRLTGPRVTDYDENTVTGEITALVGLPAASVENLGLAADKSGAAPVASSAGWQVPAESLVETVKVLVSVAEMQGGTWRKGHSAQVARHALGLGARIGLDDYDLAMLELAAYLHELGKPDDPHLTLLGISKVPDQRALADKVWSTPLELLENAKLPIEVVETLGSLYEQVDGHGLPQQRKERGIPTLARILSVVDAYVELTTNPFGAAGGKLKTQARAMDVLRPHGGTLFDANLVEILDQTTSGHDLRARLLGERPRLLVADPDPESSAVLELKFVAAGFEVRVARASTEVLPVIEGWQPDLLVCEVALEPDSGFTVVERLRARPAHADLPVYFVARRAPAADVERGFALGAADYLRKPVTPEVLITKARRTIATRAHPSHPVRTVAGSLAEMSVADIVEVLGKGKKSGTLHLKGASGQGDIYLDDGLIVHARADKTQGPEGFWALLRVTTGEFTFEAGTRPPARTIDKPTEWMLLEGMRRLDERTDS